MNFAIVFQIITLLIGLAATAWGGMAVVSVLLPGSSGEWGGLPAYFTTVVNAPVGIALLIYSRSVKTGSARLRAVITGVAVAVLALPVLAHVLWRLRLHL